MTIFLILQHSVCRMYRPFCSVREDLGDPPIQIINIESLLHFEPLIYTYLENKYKPSSVN